MPRMACSSESRMTSHRFREAHRLNSENNLLASLNLWEITVHDDGLHVSNLSAECHRGIVRRGLRRSVDFEFELTGVGAFKGCDVKERFWPY